MVDYAQLIGRAVATLSPNTRERRQAIYERARQTLVDKLRSIDPTLAHTDLKAERAALEAAILQVERDALRRAAPPQRHRPSERYGHSDRPPLTDSRKPLRIAAGALGIALIIGAGFAAYSFWPRSLDDVRNIARSRSSGPEPEEIRSDYVRLRQLVYYRTNQPAGTIVVDKTQAFLYVVRPNLAALRYSIGVGTECTALAGLYRVARKEELPGGKQSDAAGSRVLYLDKQDYRIHGFDGPTRLSLSEGCIRLVNEDVNYLYEHTPLQTHVVVAN
jgi:hypothetical protein